ncbi:MAG TPA: lamin tail domain-containing protein, partial [Anaerolineales bacterium]|nr:lamin tail domain-containing protein [Anaerolineales bacterium]
IPIRFAVRFSEPIDTRFLAIADFVQTGTATGLVWSIADSGNHMNFTLSITDVTGAGTIVPFMPANRVQDMVGNVNVDSAGGDNSVTFTRSGAPSVVISEFRTRGPNGSEDEFIELYNPTVSPIDISGWKIYFSTSTGVHSLRATIPKATLLRSGQYYLIVNSSGYNMSVPANLTYSIGVMDNGGIALVRANNSIVDQVGMSTGGYREGTPLAILGGNEPRSYERLLGGDLDSCQDIGRNNVDFAINPDPSPRNYTYRPLRICGKTLTNPVSTTLTITAHAPDPSLVNEYVKVSVKLTGKNLLTNGVKVYITGANQDCVATLNASGNGACSVRFISTGTKTITATYLGNNAYLGSKATATHHVVIRTPTRIPTRAPTPVPPPPLVGINEFVPRPGHDWNNDGLVNTGDEYIELINHGVVDVSLNGYRLDDEANVGSEPYSLPSVTLKPGERKVFYGKETGLLLSDGGDGVRLLKSNGQLADAYNYSVVRFPDQSYCRLPDNGGLDDWNETCSPTPGLQNTRGSSVNPPAVSRRELLCPIADTLPDDFAFAECQPLGNNIWNPFYWDRTGWFDEKNLPGSPGKSPVFAE